MLAKWAIKNCTNTKTKCILQTLLLLFCITSTECCDSVLFFSSFRSFLPPYLCLPSSVLAQPCVSFSRSRLVQSIYSADTNSHHQQLSKHGPAGPPGEVQHICRSDSSGCISLPVPSALDIYIFPECVRSWSGERVIPGPLHSLHPHAALWIFCSWWKLAARGCGAFFWNKITASTARKSVCSLRFLGEPGSDVPGAPACCWW